MNTADIETRDPDQLICIIDEQDQEINWLREEIRLLKHQRYGASNEKINPDQMTLLPFDEEQYQSDLDDITNQPNTIATHKRRKPKRLVLAAHLKRERVEIDLAEEDKTCSCCNEPLTKISEDITEKVEYVPASLTVKEYARAKYACKTCTGIGSIKRAELPPMIAPKSVLSASLLAHIIIAKFTDHLPLNRIERQFERLGFTLPRAMQGRGLLNVAEKIHPIVKCMEEAIREGPCIATDDTIMPLQNDIPGRGRVIQARLWVYRGGLSQNTGDPPLIVFRFTRTRQQAEPLAFFENYQGYMMADGYPGYSQLFTDGTIKHIACLAHVRRKFFEVVASAKKTHRAHEAIAIIKQLYVVEKVVKTLEMNRRSAYRQEHAKPILKMLERWLLKNQPAALPKSKLGMAINYTVKLWPALTRYVEAGYLDIDNNAVERIVRTAALGRKNYLFAGSERSGEAIAIFYSLVESAKAQNINVLDYLTDVLERLPLCKTSDDYRVLMPNRWVPFDKV